MSDSNKLVEVAPLSRLKIRNISMALREAIRLPNNQAFPIAYFIENMLIDLDPKFEFYILEMKEMGTQEGLTIPDAHCMYIRQDVYDGASNKISNPRDLFTLAHELGHYLLHTTDRVRFARNSNVEPYRQPEWQANTFAAELLCPGQIAKTMSVSDLVTTFKVSQSVAEIQRRVK